MKTTTLASLSPLSLGTVELGMDYGFQGSSHRRRPHEKDALEIIRRAQELGIQLLDTAPSYGDIE